MDKFWLDQDYELVGSYPHREPIYDAKPSTQEHKEQLPASLGHKSDLSEPRLVLPRSEHLLSSQPIIPRKSRDPTLTAKAWEPYKARIIDLYIIQGLTLNNVMQKIEEEFGFSATYVCYL
jgi:hypothetical protein